MRIIEAITTNNKMPFCQSEAVAYMDYVSNLVDDLEPGALSKADILMHWKGYAGDMGPNGT